MLKGLKCNLPERKAATRPMLVLRVERLDAQGNMRVSKPLWLSWVGEEMPPLEEVWQLYLRRFTITGETALQKGLPP